MAIKTFQPWGIDKGPGDNKPEYMGSDFRKMMDLFFRDGTGGISANQGKIKGMLVSADDNKISIERGGCRVALDDGTTVITGTDGGDLDIVARHASWSRKDLVICRVKSTGDSGRGSNIEILPGAPAANPDFPALPPNSIILAYLTIPPSGAIYVYNSAWIASLEGTIVGGYPWDSLNSFVPNVSQYKPLTAWIDGGLHLHDGTKWNRIGAVEPETSHMVIPTPNYVGHGGWNYGQLIKRDGWVNSASLTMWPISAFLFKAGIVHNMGKMIPPGFRPKHVQTTAVRFIQNNKAYPGFARLETSGDVGLCPMQDVNIQGNAPSHGRIDIASSSWPVS